MQARTQDAKDVAGEGVFDLAVGGLEEAHPVVHKVAAVRGAL